MPYKDKFRQKEYLCLWEIKNRKKRNKYHSNYQRNHRDYSRNYQRNHRDYSRDYQIDYKDGYYRKKSKNQYKNFKHYLRDKQRAKIGTTDFKQHRQKDFNKEIEDIKKEKKRTLYNWKQRYYGGQTYYDSLHKHLSVEED